VAPPGNQAENRENKRCPTVRGVPGLLKTPGFPGFPNLEDVSLVLAQFLGSLGDRD